MKIVVVVDQISDFWSNKKSTFKVLLEQSSLKGKSYFSQTSWLTFYSILRDQSYVK